METGDCTPVCMCDECRARRAALQGGEGRIPTLSLGDMADIYPEAASVIRSVSKDAWIICEMYIHPLNNPAFQDAANPAVQRLLSMPGDVFWQWSERRLKPEMLASSAQMPEHLRKFRHIQRFHYGTQWDGGRHALVADQIQRLARFSADFGMSGLSMFGECSPFHANRETNYLALAYFADHPHASLDDFAADALAPRWGGAELARRYLELGILSRTPKQIPAAVKEIAAILPSLHDFDQVRRWTYLASFLASCHWEARQDDPAIAGERIDLDTL